MIITSYDGTQAEQDRITAEKTAEGYTLTHISNITEGNFLGFVKNPIQQPIPIEIQLTEIQNTIDILLLKQEGII